MERTPPTSPSKRITSAANPQIKAIKALSMRKYRDRDGVFLAEGLRHVTEAIEAGWRLKTFVYETAVAERPLVQKALREAAKQHAQILEVSADILTRLTKRDNAQAVLGVFAQAWTDLSQVSRAGGLWVALEEVRDPGNLGTIMRTADAVGARGVILIGECCDAYSSEAVRASMGSIARVALARTDLAEFLRWRSTYPGRIYGTHLEGAVDYRTVPYEDPLILLMGNEQAGLSEQAAGACDVLIKIPMAGRADSLNLAVATGVTLFEACRARLSLQERGNG